MEEMKEVANELAIKLSDFFIVHKYCAYSSDSVYIKLDYGMGGSIRVSDHKGKKRYKYKYNIMKNIENRYEEVENGVTRKYYPFKEVNIAIADILIESELYKITLGNDYYIWLEIKKKEAGKASNSFWKEAVKISRGVIYGNDRDI